MQTRIPNALPVYLAMLLTFSSWADPLQNWQWRSSWPPAGGITGLTFGEGAFVAVGNEGTILTSPTGRIWTREVSPTSNPINGVCYGNGMFVAVGFQTILTSADGHVWIDQSSGISATLYAVAYGNGVFVAVGFGGVILTSTNGSQWSPQSAGPISNLTGIDFANGTFFAAGIPGILSSTDGVQWTPRYTATRLRAITHGGGTLVAVGDSQPATLIRYSTDGGTTWLAGSAGTNRLNLRSVAYGNALFVAASLEGVILISSDGAVWNPSPSVEYPSLMLAVTYADGKYIAGGGSVSGNIWISSNALHWARVDDSSSHYAVAFGNNVHIAVGAGSNVLTSTDGEIWTPRSLGQYRLLNGIAFGGATFAAVGNGGTILTSSDGSSWTAQNPGTNVNFSSVTYGNSNFVAAGGFGSVSVSSNGVQWQTRPLPIVRALQDITWSGQEFIAVTGDADVLRSTNAMQWTVRQVLTNSFTNSHSFHSVAYGNGQYVVVGQHLTVINDIISARAIVATSATGTNWTIQPMPSIAELSDVTFAHGVFIAVGSDGTILTSTNGATWLQRNSGTTRDLLSVIYGKGRFTAVGVLNTIVQSGFYGPPVFTSVRMMPAGFEMTIGAGPNQNCRLQFSETTAPLAWQDLQSFTTAEIPVRLTDTTVSNAPARLYRVVCP